MSFRPCIVVPVYNHAVGATELAGRLAPFGLATIMVDDGSDASCRDALSELSSAYDWLEVVAHPENRGKGAAVLTGLRAARARGYTHALQIDADGQHDSADIPRFLAKASENCKAVITGQPIFDESVPRGRQIARYLTHFWVWVETLSFTIRDSMCGFRVYPLDQVVSLADRVQLGQRMDFDPEVLVRLHWAGAEILSLRTHVRYPRDGVSHFRLVHDNLLITWMHVRLFFGMLLRTPRWLFRRRPERQEPQPHEAEHHWASLEERGVYLAMKSMLVTYRMLGRGGFLMLLYPVMLYFFLANGTARRASHDFLSRVRSFGAEPGRSSEPANWRQSFRHFLSFGDALLDKLRAWTDEISLDDVDFENAEAFDSLAESKRGALLIASHLGNAEVCRALGTRVRGLKINVLVHTKHADNFNRMMQKENRESAVSLIQTTEVGPDTAIMLREKVDAGEFVVIVGDRTPVSQSNRWSWASFLGSSAPFPQGPYILASLLKCPVLLLFCLKEEGRFRITFEHFVESVVLPRARRRETLDGLVAQYASRLEHHCLKHPYQWFNFFDFWSQAHEGQGQSHMVSQLKAPEEVQVQ